MIRIMGIQKGKDASSEFLLLQNQCSMRVNLRGYAIVSDRVLQGPSERGAFHFFCDDVMIGPGQYVLLHTRRGEPGWTITKDGCRVYNTFVGAGEPIWTSDLVSLHVLAPQHSFAERREHDYVRV